MFSKLLSFAKIIFLAAVVLITISAVVFFYQFYSTGQKIFAQEKSNAPFTQQISELIFPSEKQPKLKGEESNQINILLLGIGGKGHSGGGLTDTIMVASVKPNSGEAALISIPRDLYVRIPDSKQYSKINAVKQFGDSSKNLTKYKSGSELIKKTVGEITGLNIHYCVQLDFQGFIEIIDHLGGIDINLEKDINDPNYPNFNHGYDPFYISAGRHHLDGSTALKVARSRHSKMGDFDRVKRQQKIIRAAKQKFFEKYANFNLFALNKIFNSLGSHLKTDIQLKEIKSFYRLAKKIDTHKITSQTIDTSNYLQSGHIGGAYTLKSKSGDYQELHQFSKNIFKIAVSEEKRALIKNEKAKIEIQNGSGIPELANKVAGDLENLGFQIIKSINIPADFEGVIIYVRGDGENNNKPETLSFLKEKFNANVQTTEGDALSDQADFAIVLGKGF